MNKSRGKIIKGLDDLDKIAKKSQNRWRWIFGLVLVIFIFNIVIGYLIVNSKKGLWRPMGLEEVVVKIHSDTGVGTGFFVTGSTGTYVLTAAHVAKDVGNIVALENAKGDLMEGKVVASGYSEWHPFLVEERTVREGATPHDWALIEVVELRPDQAALFLGSVMDTSQGANVFLAGHPYGQALTITKGIISRIEEEQITTDSEIDPGFSGGPMIMVIGEEDPEDGMVVGIMVSNPQEMTTVKTAVPIDIVVRKCREAGYELL